MCQRSSFSFSSSMLSFCRLIAYLQCGSCLYNFMRKLMEEHVNRMIAKNIRTGTSGTFICDSCNTHKLCRANVGADDVYGIVAKCQMEVNREVANMVNINNVSVSLCHCFRCFRKNSHRNRISVNLSSSSKRHSEMVLKRQRLAFLLL